MKITDRMEMYKKIEKHGELLNQIFGTSHDPVTLCKKLRRLENKQHLLALDLCNGLINLEAYDKKSKSILPVVQKLLGGATEVILNGDPRGYGLKLTSAFTRDLRDKGLNIFMDMGGYGILAPDFTPSD